MALNPTLLESTAAASIFAQLKTVQDPKIPTDTSTIQRADIDTILQDIANAVAKAMPDIINHFLSNAQIQVTVPPGTFLTAAQAGVPNPAPVPINGIISA